MILFNDMTTEIQGRASDRPSTYGDLTGSPIFDRTNESGAESPSAEPTRTFAGRGFTDEYFVFDSAGYYNDPDQEGFPYFSYNPYQYKTIPMVQSRVGEWVDEGAETFTEPILKNPSGLQIVSCVQGSQYYDWLVLDRPGIWRFYVYCSDLSSKLTRLSIYLDEVWSEEVLTVASVSNQWYPNYYKPNGEQAVWPEYGYMSDYINAPVMESYYASTEFVIDNYVKFGEDSFNKLTSLFIRPIVSGAARVTTTIIARRIA